MRRRLLVAVAAALAFAVALGVVVLVGWQSRLRAPYAGWEGESVTVEFAPGRSAGAMLRELERRGVVRSARAVEWWLRVRGGGEALHAGEYRFDRPASALDVLERLRRGDVLLHSVTVPEGLTLFETADLFAAAGFSDVGRLRAAFGDPAPVRDLAPGAPDLEGYLHPETYRFPKGTGAEAIRDAMVARFRDVAVPEIVEGAAAHGLSLAEAVVLASLVEEETSVPDERPLVSAVFHNRLRRGMLLQCDPTVRYALQRAGRPVGRLTFADLRFDSPWNTYVRAGLPPTPIASPGRESLRAAVRPADSPALYFVAAPDGGHRFSNTLAEHNRAVAVWRRHQRETGLR